MYDTGQTLLALRWVAAAFLIGCVGYGLTRRRSQNSRRRYWPNVCGRVVAEQDSGYIAGGTTIHDSIVRFRTLDGVDIQGVPRGGVYLGLPVIGRDVQVWYDPRDPNLFEARIYALDRAGSLPFLLAIVPAVLFIVSFLP